MRSPIELDTPDTQSVCRGCSALCTVAAAPAPRGLLGTALLVYGLPLFAMAVLVGLADWYLHGSPLLQLLAVGVGLSMVLGAGAWPAERIARRLLTARTDEFKEESL